MKHYDEPTVFGLPLTGFHPVYTLEQFFVLKILKRRCSFFFDNVHIIYDLLKSHFENISSLHKKVIQT